MNMPACGCFTTSWASATGRRSNFSMVRTRCIWLELCDFYTIICSGPIEKRIPLHREGRPEEVAQAIAMLVSNDFITRENIAIDGGMTMRIV
jgi:NAD(P)-dependent dehydrogenase (short-subunit alcohol dehydrogenase family)